MKKLFVYGSLKRSEYNHSRFLGFPGTKFICETTINGYTLYNLGSYPTAVKEEGSYIEGEIFEVDEKIFNRIQYMEEEAGYDVDKIEDVYLFYMPKNRLNLKYTKRIGSFWSWKLYGR